LENSSNTSFLHQAMMPRADDDELFAEPMPSAARKEGETELLVEPVHRFVKTSERQLFSDAIENVRGELGGFHPLMIGGQDVITEQRILSFNPARPSELVGEVSAATEKEADSAVAAASSALPAWRECPASERARLLRNAARLLSNRRDQFSAWEIFEVGKTWREADADVAEAIDYLHYYADQAERLDAGHRFDVPGETNAYLYQPRGVAIILPPWNFPLAIATGMLSAAIVCGNTAILKPSSQSPVTAALLVRLLHEVGVPEGVVSYLPAEGRTVGEYLVRHPKVNLIAFTGSRQVGIRIQQLATKCMAEQGHVKHVIAEMGGKNGIIVDEDADLDDAIAGIVASAFGYAGQKCSACSRVIALNGIYDELLPRLVQAAGSLPIGPPEDPSTFLGPVISASAKKRIEQAISAGQERGLLLQSKDVPGSDDSFFIGPAIFSDVRPDDPIAQEEIFGPVLAFMKAENFDQALKIANCTPYALAGGVYSRNPHHLHQSASMFDVGNLYLNRAITGAVVGRNPFGGFRMSGVGHKAGGPDYLLQFVQAKTVTENTLRRGFAPE
jgi:RHH-type proline utilization regulon transcriptional repressor/proline dehydrogenase/delta 1-pyrroline-5-carboxylate dehydrogenase